MFLFPFVLMGIMLIALGGCSKKDTTTLGPVPVLETMGIYLIGSDTASSGGVIASDGGSTITSRGVCWSTGTTPTISNRKTNDGAGAGTFFSKMTGLTVNTTYYVRAYATNANGTGYGSTMSFKTILTIGTTYQGGKIAYILQNGDPGYVSGEFHGLIAAPADQSTIIVWCNGNPAITQTSDNFGTGNANTVAIVNATGSGTYAAKLCSDLVLGGYSDWYLPSISEMGAINQNQAAIGGFVTDTTAYWSSSIDAGYVKALIFGPGTVGTWDPSMGGASAHVRAVRSF
jgi:hypothetical protein